MDMHEWFGGKLFGTKEKWRNFGGLKSYRIFPYIAFWRGLTETLICVYLTPLVCLCVLLMLHPNTLFEVFLYF
jgi:hypothetical protein